MKAYDILLNLSYFQAIQKSDFMLEFLIVRNFTDK